MTAPAFEGFSFLAYRGELAALATAACWTVSALAFTAAAHRLGSLVLNILRLAMACGLFVVLEWAVRGHPLPTDATAHNWFWLGLSGLVGFTMGDLCLFRAFVLIGPRLAMLVMSLVPILTTLLGWLVLEERMAQVSVLGMVLTVGGVAWVVMERRPTEANGTAAPSGLGLVLALVAATGQAVGLVLSKLGMEGYDAFASTQIRATAGLAGFIVILCFVRAWPKFWAAFRNPGGMTFSAIGAVFGPFLGVSLAMTAVKYTQAGIAATIMAIMPVLIIPFAILIYHERVSLRAVFGAVLAVAGVAMLFLWPGD
jgi:drug/metabolite transporter (DMT)-like permease